MKNIQISLLFFVMLLIGKVYSQNNYYTPFETDIEVIKLFDNKEDTAISTIFEFQLRDTLLNKRICFYDGFITEAQKNGNVIHFSHYDITHVGSRVKISNTILILSDGCYEVLEYFDSDLSSVKSIIEIKKLTADEQLSELFLQFLKTHNYSYLEEFLKVFSERKFEDLVSASSYRYFLYKRRFLKMINAEKFTINKNQNFTTDFKDCRN